jgi:TetR/AcrR family tetracycline transcriptional repressor
MAAREGLIGILLANGFPPELAALSYATLSRYIPATVSVADRLPVPLDDEFAFGLELIIDGLTHVLQRHPPGRKSKRRSG